MRSNGLTAAAYRPVADLNPALVEGWLDQLRERRIAAYFEPVQSPSMSGFDRPEYRVEVLVRLYVDAAASDQVVELLASEDPGLVSGNDDLAWAQIVAGYDVPAAGQVAPWPVYEDVDAAAAGSTDSGDALAQARDFEDADGWADAAHWPGRPVAPADDERFVPPAPPPLPRLSVPDRLGWLGLLGGPTVLVIAAIFSIALPSIVLLVSALGFIAGFVLLVVRMSNGEDRLDDPDNGAQV